MVPRARRDLASGQVLYFRSAQHQRICVASKADIEQLRESPWVTAETNVGRVRQRSSRSYPALSIWCAETICAPLLSLI